MEGARGKAGRTLSRLSRLSSDCAASRSREDGGDRRHRSTGDKAYWWVGGPRSEVGVVQSEK